MTPELSDELRQIAHDIGVHGDPTRFHQLADKALDLEAKLEAMDSLPVSDEILMAENARLRAKLEVMERALREIAMDIALWQPSDERRLFGEPDEQLERQLAHWSEELLVATQEEQGE